jgi:hypothetical protein
MPDDAVPATVTVQLDTCVMWTLGQFYLVAEGGLGRPGEAAAAGVETPLGPAVLLRPCGLALALFLTALPLLLRWALVSNGCFHWVL